MVRNDNASHFFSARSQALTASRNLPPVDPAILKGKQANRIDSLNDDFIVGVKRLQVFADVPLVFLERVEAPGNHIVERDVVISGHNDLRKWQRVQEFPGFFEFAAVRALSQIAGDYDNIWFSCQNRGDQRRHRGAGQASEVRV
jgi:hypothetical protein